MGNQGNQGGDSGGQGGDIGVGDGARLEFVVSDADTALALGSGDLPVLGTPRLVAWCEAATCAVVQARLGAGRTSVGTKVVVEHLAPSPVDAKVSVSATLVYAEDRQLRFEVLARHGDGPVIGRGEVSRVIVDGDRFLARMSTT